MARRYEYPVWTPRTFNDGSLRWLFDEQVALHGVAQFAGIERAERLDFAHRQSIHRPVLFPSFTWRESDLFYRVPWQSPLQPPVELYVALENESAPAALDRIRLFCVTGGVWQDDLARWERQPEPREPFRPLLLLPILFYTRSEERRVGKECRL